MRIADDFDELPVEILFGLAANAVEALLGTRVLLWWLADDTALGDQARRAIASRDSAVFVSAASA